MLILTSFNEFFILEYMQEYFQVFGYVIYLSISASFHALFHWYLNFNGSSDINQVSCLRHTEKKKYTAFI